MDSCCLIKAWLVREVYPTFLQVEQGLKRFTTLNFSNRLKYNETCHTLKHLYCVSCVYAAISLDLVLQSKVSFAVFIITGFSPLLLFCAQIWCFRAKNL